MIAKSSRLTGPARRSRSLRRLALATMMLLPAVGTLVAQACATSFDPPSAVNTLRIISVEADLPYALPGDTVNFNMLLADGRGEDTNPNPVNTLWLGGCFNPTGGQYYGCYQSLAEVFGALAEGGAPPPGTVGGGPGITQFGLAIPEDILDEVPEPNVGSRVGTAFLFFVACDGEIRPTIDAEDPTASSFPIGCFDSSGVQLGPEAFVPGYTQIFVFEDGRMNANPAVRGLQVDGETLPADEVLSVETCPITLEERQKSGCAARDEFTECGALDIDVDVPEEAAEDDPGATDVDGNQLSEVLWVSYFATGGQFENDLKLVSDASTGLVADRSTRWVAPEEPGLYSIWAVVRDNRGGSRTVTHFVQVQEP